MDRTKKQEHDASAKSDITGYKFKIMEVGGIPYRFPQINMN